MTRDLIAVLEEVKKAIPKSWIKAPKVKRDLTAVQIGAKRESDKDGHEALWEIAAQILKENLGELDFAWKKKVYAIWAKRR